MATYVLVHGGGHGGWCWGRLAPLLRAAGHEVFTPTLTGLGERAHLLRPGIDLDTQIADVLGVLAYEDLHDVILVGHSYGGMVITGVADRALERVGQLVFLDAAIPRNGESLADTSPGLQELVGRHVRTVDGVELALWPDPHIVSLYGVTAPDQVAWMAGKLTPHPWACLTQKLHLTREAELLKLPRTNINCTSTLDTRSPEGVERALQADRVWEIDTGHDLMITEPRAVADMLLQLAALPPR
ncbi:alpha/beta hydrolase [Phenylobacterium sp. LjRoot225]|uniref:alpha/beta hydrolase n=1 Tax=Phenylobacterium sp. LjRoot225 TaxID=3342285 RepID=UPI003ED154AD